MSTAYHFPPGEKAVLFVLQRRKFCVDAFEECLLTNGGVSVKLIMGAFAVLEGGALMQARVNVSDDVLRWIMAQVRLDSLPDKIANNLAMWYKKEKTPTFNQIEDTSRATGIPLGYFFLKTPPQEDLSLVEYRTVDSAALTNPSRELIDTIHDMERVQEWMRDQLVAEGALDLSFVGALKMEKVTDRFADSVREILGLDVDWFKKSEGARTSFNHLRTEMNNIGVIVMTSGIVANNTHRTLDINEFRAFAMEDDIAPLIFINGNDSENGKLFSLLHEFAHLCLGESSLYNERYYSEPRKNHTETICNAATAEILVPQVLFVEAWQTEIKNADEEQVIRILAKDFRCGLTVVARRALDSGFIEQKLYNKIAELAIKLYNEQKKKQKESGGGDYYKTVANRIDARFLRMLVGSVATGKTLYSDAFRLTNTNRFTFAKLIEHAGGGRNE